MLKISVLENKDVHVYGSLTFRYLLPLLEQIGQESEVCAVGAATADEAVGLVVARLHCTTRSAEIMSIYIKKPYRRKGIGMALMKALEQYIDQSGCNHLRLSYVAGKSITPVFEAFLRNQSWNEPKLQSYIYTVDFKISEAPWLITAGLPKDVSLFKWSELTPSERDDIQTLPDIGFLSPLRSAEKIEFLNSLGLRAHGKVIGWCIVHRAAPDTLLYNSLYVQGQYQSLGCAFIMLTEAIRLQLEAGIPKGMFAVNLQTPQMLSIAERWLAPYASQKTEMRFTQKMLGQSEDKRWLQMSES